MKEHQIRQVLEEIAEKEIPTDLDLWPDLQIRIKKMKPQPSYRNFKLFATRLGRVGMAITIFLIFITVVYASSPALQDLLKMDPGLSAVDSNGLGQSLNLRQAIEDVIVTLRWAYADENRIAIAFEMETSDGQQYKPKQLILTDDRGNIFPAIAGLGTGEEYTEQTEGSSLLEGEYVFSFDTASVTDTPDTLHLYLEMKLESEIEQRMIGPIVFDFIIPFHSGQEIKLGQSITSEGVAVTLQEVVITPSGIMAVICFNNPQKDYNSWLPISQIDVKSTEILVDAQVGSQTNPDEAGCTNNRYFPSLHGYTGTWELTITELVGFQENDSGQLRISGPWVFQFEVP